MENKKVAFPNIYKTLIHTPKKGSCIIYLQRNEAQDNKEFVANPSPGPT